MSLPAENSPETVARHAGTGEARLARQPIVDRGRNLVGFELSYCGATGEPPPPGMGARWTSLLLNDLFAGVGLDRVIAGFTGYVNVDSDFLGSRMVEILPPSRVRLELGDTIRPGPESLARVAALRQMGYGLILDHYAGERERVEPLLPYVDAIKVDVSWTAPTHLADVARPFAGGRKALIAEKVESTEQFQLALASGFDLFQGYHFSRPELVKGRRLQADLPALLRLLNLVTKGADLGDIEAEFKRQPAMSVNLLKLANSAASGMRTPARTLREAILRTGLKPMRTWLQLLVYTAGGGGGASPLLHTAALRGRLMELLAIEANPHERELADRALMVGLLSLMHVVFGTTRDAFVADLQLDEDMSAALNARVGTLGLLLEFVEAREGAAPAQAALPGMDERVIGRLEAEAFRWASELASAGL